MKPKIRLTKIFEFEMAHALHQYDGACKNIHGHSYCLEVTIIGTPINDENSPKNGMLMDFSELKTLISEQIVSQMDHALVLHQNTDSELLAALHQHYEKIILTPYQPTIENMLCDFAERLIPKLPQNVSLYALKLQETATSFGIWCATDQN